MSIASLLPVPAAARSAYRTTARVRRQRDRLSYGRNTRRYELTRVDLSRGHGPGQAFGDKTCQSGLKRMTSDGPFTATLWGRRFAASYAYPGGMAHRKLVTTPLDPRADAPRSTARISAERTVRTAIRTVPLLEEGSDDLYVLGPRSLRSLAFVERNALPLLEVLEANTFDRRHVEEEVLPRPGLDESEALVRQSLDRSFSHLIQPFFSGCADRQEAEWLERGTLDGNITTARTRRS
jgi:hypothetical protein